MAVLEHGSTNVPEIAPADTAASAALRDQARFFDGQSNRRHSVKLSFGEQCKIVENDDAIAQWPYDRIRRVDAPPGVLRLSCLAAPALARLEIREGPLARELAARCPNLDIDNPGSKGSTRRIVGWSLAALVSIVFVVIYGVPFAAERLTPLVPQSFESRIGEAADKQIRLVFDGKVCSARDGQAAFVKLVGALRDAGGFAGPVDVAVLSTEVPNAFALPGGKIYLLNGLLEKAHNSDEIAGVLAHELGHVRHRDSMRNLIYNGGTSFLIGLLFGDVTGSSALLFASRTMFDATYTREAEANADAFSIDLMHRLGRSPKPMGELLLRVTGNEKDKNLSFLSNHPFTEDRLALMQKEDRPPTAPPILSDDEWMALRSICKS
jgi:Zn-dependent protease with chaperone function